MLNHPAFMRPVPSSIILAFLLASWIAFEPSARAQSSPEFSSVRRLTNGDVALEIQLPTGSLHRVESSSDLLAWQGLVTLSGAATPRQHTDTSAVRIGTRFYRAMKVEETNAITGDHLATDGPDVVVHPVNHASLVLRWGERFIYNDPVEGTAPYRGLPKPDLILVSHQHGDHFDASTLSGLRQTGTLIVAPAVVFSSLSSQLKAITVPLANGQQTNLFDIQIEAIPAYNGNHPKGAGNAYVVTMGGRRLFLSGDTGNTAEMRALTGIDVAFVCMNVPYTMTIPDALTAVRAFRPRVVYPYHYRNADRTLANLASFRNQLAADPDIEVRLRSWY